MTLLPTVTQAKFSGIFPFSVFQFDIWVLRPFPVKFIAKNLNEKSKKKRCNG